MNFCVVFFHLIFFLFRFSSFFFLSFSFQRPILHAARSISTQIYMLYALDSVCPSENKTYEHILANGLIAHIFSAAAAVLASLSVSLCVCVCVAYVCWQQHPGVHTALCAIYQIRFCWIKRFLLLIGMHMGCGWCVLRSHLFLPLIFFSFILFSLNFVVAVAAVVVCFIFRMAL